MNSGWEDVAEALSLETKTQQAWEVDRNHRLVNGKKSVDEKSRP